MTTTAPPHEETAPARPRPHAEFMQIWEEGYVSNHVSFENMQTPGLFVVSGERLLRADGSVDRSALLTHLAATIASTPTFRLRLQRSALGLTPPAWVPDETFDLRRHVIVSDRAVDFDTADLRELSGAYDPVFSLRHPLWRMRVTPLTDGKVAVGMMFHHAITDGLSGMRLFSSISQSRVDDPLPVPQDPFAGVRAARAWELPVLAVRQWLERTTSVGERWRGYWAKPFHRRARRVAARVTLPLRYHRGGERARAEGLPPRHSAYRRMDAGLVSRRARSLGGTLSDLLVASIIAAWPGEDRVVRLRFPVSFHSRNEPHVRNHVRDMEVFGDADAEVSATVVSVHRQVEERDDSRPYPAVPGTPIGYSTLLPWVSRPRFFCGGEIIDVIPFPASLGRDRLAAAGIMYRGTLFVGANMPVEMDVEHIVGRIFEHMTGEPDPGRPRFA